LLDIISKNISQSLAERNIILNTTTTPFIYYTCPVGKRASIKGWVRCVDRGGASNCSFEAAGVVMWIWNTNAGHQSISDHPAYTERTQAMTTSSGGDIAMVDLVLEAGQFIRVIQNAFTNAQFKCNFKVKELPA